MSTPSTVYLVDASPYIFRAYFSIKGSMKAPDGQPVNAVYGFASFVLKMLTETELTHVAMAFDRSLNTSFRNEVYPPYKAQRELPPQELEKQLHACEAFVRALGIATYIDDRYEADDLIAGVLRGLPEASTDAVIVSSDKDLAQLVDGRVSLWDYARDIRYDEEKVVEKFGVRPTQIVDYLGLAGDAVDNIPGVKGVGAKTASSLLAHFDDLDALYADLDSVATVPVRGAKSLGAKLADQREQAFLSRQLATVASDKPAGVTLDDLAWSGADRARLEPLLENLGFERMANRVPRWLS